MNPQKIFETKIPEIFVINDNDVFYASPLAYVWASMSVNEINARVIYNPSSKYKWSCRVQEKGKNLYLGNDNDLELSARRLLAQIEESDEANSKYLAVLNWKFLAINQGK